MQKENIATRRKYLKSIGATGTLGLIAGCTGGGGGSDGGDGGSDGGDGGSDGGDGGMDFGGQTLEVNLSVAGKATVHQEHIIPKVEEKYNLKINAGSAATTEQLATLEANPDDPPDVLNLNMEGIPRAVDNEWLEPLSDYEDIVTNLDNILDDFVLGDGHAAAWEIDEIGPVINTDEWDSTPESWTGVANNSEEMAITPFAWGSGPYMLLMAAAIATDTDVGSANLDVQAGFDWLKSNVVPKTETQMGGTQEAIQMITSGTVDTLMPMYTYTMFAPFNDNQPIKPLSGLQPSGLITGTTMAVAAGSDKKEAAMAYVNEALAPEFQKTASGQIGVGVTNTEAELDPKAKEYGVPTVDNYDQFTHPDFEFIRENRSNWTDRWQELFG